MADTEREAFEKAMGDSRFFPAELDFSRTKSPSGRDEYANSHLQSNWEGWQARSALASRPAEVDDEGLPEVLFDGHAVYSEITRKLGKAHCHNHETVSATLDAVVRLMRAAPAKSS